MTDYFITETPSSVVPTTEEQPGSPTSNARIEGVLFGLRTRHAGHLADAIALIEAMRAERERRRTAQNVLGVIVSLLLNDDLEAPPRRAMDPMRRAMLESALERAVLALYPENITKRVEGDDGPVR